MVVQLSTALKIKDSMSLLLDFHDAVIYQRDLKNFKPENWLNDACIGFCMRYMEHVVFRHNQDILFMDPSVVSLIKVQCMDDEDMEGISQGLKIKSKSLIFVPTNDNNSFQDSSSHWSLLVLDMVNEQAYHLDSSRPFNRNAAEVTYERMQPLLNWTKFPPVREMFRSPQQCNGYDCGVYVCLTVQSFASSSFLPALLKRKISVASTHLHIDEEHIVQQIEDFVISEVTQAKATRFREETIARIMSLSEDYGRQRM